MHAHGSTVPSPDPLPVSGDAEPVTLLIGNPNVGKSVVFGHLTGRYATVSNYPGTTVEVAQARHHAGEGRVLDLPGTNGLLPVSDDERVTRDALLSHLTAPELRTVLVCDSKNLRRGLVLALSLGELEAPALLVANMRDEAVARGIALDPQGLEAALGVPVLPAVAPRREGLAPLLEGLVTYRVVTAPVHYDPAVEQAAERVAEALPVDTRGRRGLALMLLAETGDDPVPAPAGLDPAIWEAARAVARGAQPALAHALPEGVTHHLARTRQAAADALAQSALRRAPRRTAATAALLDHLTLHPLWGLPVAGAVLYGLYLFVGVLGAGEAVDFLETAVFGERLVPWLDWLLRTVLPQPLETWLVGAPGLEPATGPGLLIGDYGLISMGLSYAFAIVLPIVGFFFLAFSLLEDSGYLPRMAVLLNRAFRVAGLNGKAVLPMILGLGCDTMATMTARILPSRKERVVVTLLLALGVPCSAQLGLIMGMLAALSTQALLWWAGTVVAVMVLVGALASRVLPGESAAFLLELPPLRRPRLGNIVVKTLARMEWYLREVVPLFLLGTFVLWVLHAVNALGTLERLAAPVVQGVLGLPAKATEAFLIGFLRRDYGAAGLYDLFRPALAGGNVTPEVEVQIVVALATVTLFVPCIANLLMIVKERGWRTALGMSAFIFPFAFVVGGLLNLFLREVWL